MPVINYIDPQDTDVMGDEPWQEEAQLRALGPLRIPPPMAIRPAAAAQGPPPQAGDFALDDSTSVMGPAAPTAPPQSFGDLDGQEAPPAPAGAGPAPAGLTAAGGPPPGRDYQALEQVVGQRPVLPTPKWWQRAIGAAAGAGAGWSNAASRTRNPIDIGAMQGNILAPGYAQKLQQWQSRVAPVQAVGDLEAERQGQWWKNQQLGAEAQYKQAAAEQAKKHGDYWEHRAHMEQNQWKIDPKSGTFYNTLTGETSVPPQNPQDAFRAAKALGATDVDARYFAFNHKMPEPNRQGQFENVSPGAEVYDRTTGKVVHTNPARPPDPIAEALRSQNLDDKRNNDLNKIADTKATREQTILASRRAEVERVAGPGGNEDDLRTSNPAALTAINARYAPQLQAAQDEFASSARRNHIDAPDYDVDPKTLQYRLRGRKATGNGQPQTSGQPNSQTANQPAYTEADVRQAALARHKDPDKAVAAARAKKLIQ